MEKKRKYLTQEAALLKLQAYCAYQERCHTEVMTKLRDLGLYGDRADAIVAQLIADNFLNEERFAVAYARGKHRMKHWGKIRIRQELKLRQIPEYSLKKAMAAIDAEGVYEETLKKILLSKFTELKDDPQRKNKVVALGIRKGYETELVWGVLNDLLKEIDQ